MIRCIVLNEKNIASVVFPGDLVQKQKIRRGVENFISMIVKTRSVNIHTAEDLDAFSLAGHRNKGLAAFAGPRAIKR